MLDLKPRRQYPILRDIMDTQSTLIEVNNTESMLPEDRTMALRRLEAILFMAKEPIPASRLESLAGVSQDVLLTLLVQLVESSRERGIQVIEVAGGWQMRTHPECNDTVKSFLENPTSVALSRAALEVLAIIAYRQPMTRGAIEHIRGVNSDAVASTLLEKELIAEGGKSTDIGRPTLLVTTDKFLKHFGLNRIEDLPSRPYAATQLSLIDAMSAVESENS